MKPTLSIFLALITPLAAFSPELSLVNPRGGQRGTEMEVHFHGERLEEICEALFYEPGLSLSTIDVKDGKHALAKLTLAADARLGEHSLRLCGPGGITELRSFWVGQFPSVAELEPNATFPRPTTVSPMGGKPGETVEFTFIGDPSGPIKQSITLPPAADDRFAIFPQHDGLLSPSPHWITVSPLETAAEANPAPPIPCALDGFLDGDTKSDWFNFTAKKNQNLVIRVLARSHRSPLDSVLSVHQADGKQLAINDDQGAPDSLLNWTSPADGEFRLQIRDQLKRTGPDYTYRIEITEKSPAIAASLPTVERVLSQKWKTFPIPRGNRYAAVVNLTRENTACDAVFEAGSLPAGVTMHAPTIPKSITTFPIAVTAEAKVGKHNGVFCRVLVPENGTTILHQTAMNSTLRIAAPSPVAKTDTKPATEKPADPQAKAEKPLSRLEQLRKHAKP